MRWYLQFVVGGEQVWVYTVDETGTEAVVPHVSSDRR